ncbi:hypothetical protein EsH8_VII_000977 [Colletotrichum jinshuiense]
MERKAKRSRPGHISDLCDRSGKRQATPDVIPQGYGRRAFHNALAPGAWSELHGAGIQHSGSGSFSARDIHIGVTADHAHERDGDFLRDLRLSDPRDDKARIERLKGGLLRDAYRWILDHDDFRQWHDDTRNRLLWIKGDPGKGKTMLLCGIVNELEKLPVGTCTLSYFFCQATDPSLNNAAAVLRGLIYQLLVQKRSLIARIREKYDHTGKRLFEDVNSWDALSKMLISILEELILKDPSLQSTYLVIDALDECETNLDQLLHLIVQVSSLSGVKLVVSSRNRRDIEDKLQPTEARTRLCLELKENSEHISWAVRIYITQCISELAQLQGDKVLQDQVRHRLQLKADGTFLWVSLVVQELRQAHSWEILDIIDEVPAGLDRLYGRMIQQIQQLSRKNPELCCNVLSAVTTAYRPLHLDELQALTDLPQQNIATIVALCGSFLTIRDNMVYLIHQSAKDFLALDSYVFPSGLALGHSTIALRSIEVLSRTLHRDIYSLRAPGFPIDRVRPPDPDPLLPARYSCVYWVSHLADPAGQEACRRGLKDSGPAHAFLKKHYLYWLEALSLLGSISAGILQITKLVHLAQWNACLQTLEGHLDQVMSVDFSGDGTQIASASQDNTVKIWDSNTGHCLQTLEGHNHFVNSVAFSGDSMQLASASGDKTVKVWDSTTGQCLWTLYHDRCVTSVVFSRDSMQLASTSDIGTVRVWDVTTGHCLHTLEGYSDSVNPVAFSGDSKQLASTSYDDTIKIWDSTTGQCIQTLDGHSCTVSSLAFSGTGNNTQLASSSYDLTVKIWDIASGRCLKKLEGHNSCVSSVAFSDDGMQLASASHDRTIKIWDSTTGHCLQTLKGHSDCINSVAISSNSMQLASASYDNTIKVWDWDSATGQYPQLLKVHSNFVRSVAFSPDGMQLATASDMTAADAWECTVGKHLRTLEGCIDLVSSATFSSDGKQLASASAKCTVEIWDSNTGRHLWTLEGHINIVHLVAFSGDGMQLASASGDRTVKVWDITTGHCLQTLEGHSRSVYSVAFSDDGTQLVSASQDKSIKLWDRSTGHCLQTLEGHDRFVYSVAFSCDGTQLVSASDDCTVKLWDVVSGQCLRTLNTDQRLGNISLSKNGLQLYTTIGAFDLEETSAESAALLLPTGTSEMPQFYGYAVSVDNIWITRNSVNLLWLPPEYRPGQWTVAGSTVAIGCTSGRVLVFRFSEAGPDA